MEPIFFRNTVEFRKWLEENHDKEKEVLVGFYKVGTGKLSMNWPDSVDEALCFGWIDGIRKSLDEESYCIRFTPRNPKSKWSTVNIKKVQEMIRQGKMTPAGLAAYEKRETNPTVYSYENKPERFSPDLEERFRENASSWDFFSRQAPSYKKTVMLWVMSAKQEATRFSRLEKLITASEKSQRMF
jgi:uncharacterized protein YdeI (YjbR/CyaY-like superfamily)